MKFTLSWLKEHLDTTATLVEVRDALTMLGLEVEGIANPAETLKGFVVGYVVEARKHPDADRLRVCIVDTGREQVQVVCGAPNARTGMKGVFAAAGSYIPGKDVELKKGVIRGQESNGMLLSMMEMGLGDDHDGIIELPEDAPVGTAFADYAGLTDAVIDISVTPNRPDCLGVRGIARDLAAFGLGTLKPLAVEPVSGEGPGPDVRTDDPEGCPAFFEQGVSGVTNGAAPEWRSAAMRSRILWL